MKQITIYEFLKKNEGVIKNGWVACNSNGSWRWSKYKPKCRQRFGLWDTEYERNEAYFASLTAFNIEPFEVDWRDSLIKVKQKEEE